MLRPYMSVVTDTTVFSATAEKASAHFAQDDRTLPSREKTPRRSGRAEQASPLQNHCEAPPRHTTER